MPGVVAVFTGREIDLDVTPLAMMAPGLVPDGVRRSALARDRVRFAGEAIAVVIADTAAQAVDASEAVVVEYLALPAVTTVDDTLRDEVLLFPEAGTNTLTAIPLPRPTCSAVPTSW